MTTLSRQERRRQERFTNRCEIEFSSNCETFVGVANNFSSGGLFIRTRIVFVPGTTIAMVLHLPHGSISKLTGIVIRASKAIHRGTEASYLKDIDGMGVEITDSDPSYLRFIKSHGSVIPFHNKLRQVNGE